MITRRQFGKVTLATAIAAATGARRPVGGARRYRSNFRHLSGPVKVDGVDDQLRFEDFDEFLARMTKLGSSWLQASPEGMVDMLPPGGPQVIGSEGYTGQWRWGNDPGS